MFIILRENGSFKNGLYSIVLNLKYEFEDFSFYKEKNETILKNTLLDMKLQLNLKVKIVLRLFLETKWREYKGTASTRLHDFEA